MGADTNQLFVIQQDAITQLYGIVKNENPTFWIVKPEYKLIMRIDSDVPNSENLFQLYKSRTEGSELPDYFTEVFAGLINAATGKLVLGPEYTVSHYVVETLPHLLEISDTRRQQNVKGLFNISTEQIIIPCYYDRLRPSELNPELIKTTIYEEVVETRYEGLIDSRTGKIILDTEFSIDQLFFYGQHQHQYFKNLPTQWAIKNLKTGYSGIINKEGQILLPFENTIQDGGFLDNETCENKVFFYQYRNKDGYVGVVNEQLDIIIPFEYVGLTVYKHTYDPNHKDTSFLLGNKNGKWGVINYLLQIMIPFEWDEIIYLYGMKDSVDGSYLLCVRKESKLGVVSILNRQVLPLDYDYIFPFTNNEGLRLLEVIKDNKKGLVDHNNFVIVPLDYDRLDMLWINNKSDDYLIKVTKNDKVGLIDLDNKVALPVQYSDIKNVYTNDFLNYTIEVTSGKKLGLVNQKNETIIKTEYEAFWEGGFIEGIMAAQKNKKWGLINDKAQIIAPFEYHSIINTGLSVTHRLFFKKEAHLPSVCIHTDVFSRDGYEGVKDLLNNPKLYNPQEEGLVIKEGAILFYEIGDFDAMDVYKVQLLALQPTFVFSYGYKKDKTLNSIAVIKSEIIGDTTALEEISQGYYDSKKNACPFFRLSDKMYTNLKKEQKTELRNIFGINYGVNKATIVLEKYKKKKIKVNGEKIEVNVLVGNVITTCIIEDKEVSNNDGDIIIWDNSSFPLVLSLDLMGSECTIELKEITI